MTEHVVLIQSQDFTNKSEVKQDVKQEVKQDEKKLTRPHSNSGDTFINIDTILQNRIHWVDSDEVFLKNKLRIVRAYKKLYSRAKSDYQLHGFVITIISMIFTGITPIIGTASIVGSISNMTNNLINITCGIIAVCLQVMSKILNYSILSESCSRIVTMCTDIESDIELVLTSNKEDRAHSVQVMKNIINAYNAMLKKCTYVTLTNEIIKKYKKEITKEIKSKKVSESEETTLISTYLMPTGESPIL